MTLEQSPSGAIVYLVECQGRHKIGWSADITRRLTALQTSSPWPLHVVRVIFGERRLESSLHTLFGPWRRSGEWFEFPPDILTLVIAVMDAHANATLDNEADRYETEATLAAIRRLPTDVTEALVEILAPEGRLT